MEAFPSAGCELMNLKQPHYVSFVKKKVLMMNTLQHFHHIQITEQAYEIRNYIHVAWETNLRK